MKFETAKRWTKKQQQKKKTNNKKNQKKQKHPFQANTNTNNG